MGGRKDYGHDRGGEEHCDSNDDTRDEAQLLES